MKTETPAELSDSSKTVENAHRFLQKYLRLFSCYEDGNAREQQILDDTLVKLNQIVDECPIQTVKRESHKRNSLLQYITEYDNQRVKREKRALPESEKCVTRIDTVIDTAPPDVLRAQEAQHRDEAEMGFTVWGMGKTLNGPLGKYFPQIASEDKVIPKTRIASTILSSKSETDSFPEESPSYPSEVTENCSAQTPICGSDDALPSDRSFAQLLQSAKHVTMTKTQPGKNVDPGIRESSTPAEHSGDEMAYEWRSVPHRVEPAFDNVSSTPPGMWSLHFSQTD